MTDITELAQILKAAAIDAKELAIIARYSVRAAAEKFYAWPTQTMSSRW
jgi:glutaredoxin-related protein